MSFFRLKSHSENGPKVLSVVLQKRLHLFCVALSLHDLEMTNHTLNILTVAKVKSLPWKHMT